MGAWISEDRSRLEIRAGQQAAFETELWSEDRAGDRPQRTLHLGQVAGETEAPIQWRIRGRGTLEAEAGARGGGVVCGSDIKERAQQEGLRSGHHVMLR